MKKIVLLFLLLTLSLYAEKMSLQTTKNQYIIVDENEGMLNFINIKYHKKNVLFYLFGRDCPHCQKKIPQIKKLMKNPKIKLIGVHAYHHISDDELRAYAKKVGYSFDMLSNKGGKKIIDFLEKLKIWDGSVPFTVLVDDEGNVYEVDASMIDEQL